MEDEVPAPTGMCSTLPIFAGRRPSGTTGGGVVNDFRGLMGRGDRFG